MTVVISRGMRYPPERKLVTRRRILAAASQAFRERGVAETGVDDVMRRAGLTHGGFYAHFRDKAELVAEACEVGFAEAVPNLERIAAGRTAGVRVRLLIDSYLSPRHRDNRSSGCVMVAVAADMARLAGPTRTAYSRAFRQHLVRLEKALRLSGDPEENRSRVTHLMSALVGALLFARAFEDPDESADILLRMRRSLKSLFAPPAPGLAPERKGAAYYPSHDLLSAF